MWASCREIVAIQWRIRARPVAGATHDHDVITQCDDRVRVGSLVRIQDQEGETEFSLVPAEDADPFSGLVSVESPLGRAVLGHSPGDPVRVHAPGGVRALTVLATRPGQ
jgi:transcription elongation GreA/GreB family factor